MFKCGIPGENLNLHQSENWHKQIAPKHGTQFCTFDLKQKIIWKSDKTTVAVLDFKAMSASEDKLQKLSYKKKRFT